MRVSMSFQADKETMKPKYILTVKTISQNQYSWDLESSSGESIAQGTAPHNTKRSVEREIERIFNHAKLQELHNNLELAMIEMDKGLVYTCKAELQMAIQLLDKIQAAVGI